MFETTRAVANLIMSGTLERYPRIKLIVPHAGATLPVLADRIAMMTAMFPHLSEIAPDRIVPTLGRLYYDLAGMPVPRLLPALRTFADPSRLLYGSDWPHTQTPRVEQNRRNLDSFLAAEPGLLQAIRHGNADALLKREQ